MEQWSIKELKAHITKQGGTYEDCLEKTDLIARAKSLGVSVTHVPTIEQVAELIRSKKLSKIIVMAGAGISVSAGIPDFRTPGTGLYDNLQKYNLPDPQAIFTLSYFRENPQPFFTLAKELFPGAFKPTPTHHFIKVLADRGLLLRCYTQNIDGLEGIAGVPEHLIFQAHGGFKAAHCIDCKQDQNMDIVADACLKGQICRCSECNGLVKPDIVFFGESLPERFQGLVMQDFPSCDCLIVMGTSLQVQPFASLIDMVPATAMRILINREVTGLNKSYTEEIAKVQMYLKLAQDDPEQTAMIQEVLDNLIEKSQRKDGFLFDSPENKRDIFVEGECDAGVTKLASLLGQDWLNDMKPSEHEAKATPSNQDSPSTANPNEGAEQPIDLSENPTKQTEDTSPVVISTGSALSSAI